MRTLITRVFLGLMAGVAVLPASADYVTGLDPQGDNFLALRSGPGTQYQLLQQMPPNTVLTVLESYGSWLRVELEDGSSGWAFGTYIAAGLPPDSYADDRSAVDDWVGLSGQTGAIAGGGTALKALPGPRSDVLTRVPAGSGVIILAEAAGWLRVLTAAGELGYVPAETVNIGVWPSVSGPAPAMGGKTGKSGRAKSSD